MKRIALLLVLLVAVVGGGWLLRNRATPRDAGDASAAGTASSSAPALVRPGDAARRYPHAIHDPAKRAELRARIAAALAEAEANATREANAAPSSGAPPTAPARGNRETGDLAELGRFVSEAIREDFIPMARGCAKELARRQPDAGGVVNVAFELLGDKQIGGVVNTADVDPERSTVHDPEFETCMRESLYGVYFDPPPANARATLRFDVTLLANTGGEIDDQDVDDFSNIKDRRNED